MDRGSYSESESESEAQPYEDVEGANVRLLCCRGVVVNNERQQVEHHVLSLRGDGSFYGRWRSTRRHPGRRHVAAVIPRLTMSRFPGLTSFAALGTTLCCVGGNSSDFFFLDAAMYDQIWTKGPSMLEHRVCPRVVAVGWNLFVFGGSCSATSHRASWAEVYDMNTNEWAYLPPLPSHLTPPTGTGRKSFFAAAITLRGDDSKQIVVGGWGEMFCIYQLSTRTWSCPNFDPGHMSYFTPDSVAIGNTLYSFSQTGFFLAYDFDCHTIFGGALHGEGVQKTKCLDAWTSSRDLLVLPDDDGDDGSMHLLFVWSQKMHRFLPSSSSDPSYPATRTSLLCNRVRVSKVSGSSSRNNQSSYLHASIVSSWSFPIEHSFQLQDALLMDAVEGLEELSP